MQTQNFNTTALAPALTRKEIIQIAIDAEERRLALQEGIESQSPAPLTSARPAGAKKAFTLRDAAKTLQQKPVDFQLWMEAQGWLYKKTPNGMYFSVPEKVSEGYFHTRESLAKLGGSRTWSDQIMLTPKGLDHLSLLLKNAGMAA